MGAINNEAYTMRIEANLQDNEPRLVTGIKGLKSKPFVKRFRNFDHMNRWFSANAGNFTVYTIERA